MWHPEQRIYKPQNQYTEDLNKKGETTPYHHLSILAKLWLKKYSKLGKFYPVADRILVIGESDISPEYKLLWDIVKHYTAVTGKADPYNEKDPESSEKHQDYLEEVLHYTVENETTIIKALTGKLSKKERKDLGLTVVTGTQIDMFGETEVQTKPTRPKHMKTSKISPETIQDWIQEIEDGKFPEYMRVRECAAMFNREAQKDFLSQVILVADISDHVDSRNKKRVIRVAKKMLSELYENKQETLAL